jgi:hypothetical protein
VCHKGTLLKASMWNGGRKKGVKCLGCFWHVHGVAVDVGEY